MNTKKLLIIALVFAMLLLACGTFGGAANGSNNDNGGNVNSGEHHDNDDNDYDNNDNGHNNDNDDSNSGGDMDSGLIAPVFPMPDDFSNLMGDQNSANFQTPGTIDDLVAFYRAELVDGWGLTERDLLTSITDTTASLVFDGHDSGQAVVVQMVDLGDGNINVNIRFEDV